MLPVFDIKRYSINDGPGIRITIFFKGCPLSCVWCHNPEGISPRQTKLYTITKCIACKRCVRACPRKALRGVKGRGIVTDPSKCVLCGTCAQVCPADAMQMALKNYSVEELTGQIEKERPFFETSGGGVTFCGGEPLLQGEKLFPLLEACGPVLPLGAERTPLGLSSLVSAGAPERWNRIISGNICYSDFAAGHNGRAPIHRAVDTTLFASPELVMQTAQRCELFLVDLKHMDSAMHRRFCGVPNELIHSNIRMIASEGIDFIVRIPLIIGVNADEANLRASAEFLSSLGIRREKDAVDGTASEEGRSAAQERTPGYWNGPMVELLPYHDIAKGKHLRLGSVYNPDSLEMGTPSPGQLAAAQTIFAEYGVEARF